MRRALLVLAALCLPRAARAGTVSVAIDDVAALGEVGGWAVVKLEGRELILIRETETVVRALSAICAHKKNRVGYNPKEKRIECPKHGSRYDLDGKVLKGPTRGPLSPVYPASLDVENRKILVVLEDP